MRVPLLVVSFFLVAGCRRATVPAGASSPPPACVSAVTSPRAIVHASPAAAPGFLGLVVAPATVDVTSQLEARVRAIAVRPGDRVTRGAVVAELDTRTARQELAMAAAELATARTDRQRAELELAQAEERLSRRQTTVELPSGPVTTVSGEELSAARHQQKLAAVRVAAAQAAIASRQAHLDELRTLVAEGAVRAPFDGTVAARFADVGALIHKGTPIVRLIEGGELRVRFAIPEDRADALAPGDRVRITAGSATLDAVVDKVAPEIDAASRVVFAEASLSAPARVRAGQVARVFADAPLARAR